MIEDCQIGMNNTDRLQIVEWFELKTETKVVVQDDFKIPEGYKNRVSGIPDYSIAQREAISILTMN